MRLLPLLVVLVVGANEVRDEMACAEPTLEDEAAAPDGDASDISDDGAVAAGSNYESIGAGESPLLWRTFPSTGLGLDYPSHIQAGHSHVVELSEGGKVATATSGSEERYAHITTGFELNKGRHYWEVELLSENKAGMLVGITWPALDPVGHDDEGHYIDGSMKVGWYIGLYGGELFSHGTKSNVAAGPYNQGDLVGVLLDLNDGSLLFFKNGVQHGPGYPAGSVEGPVVLAMQMYFEGQSGRVVADAVRPSGY
jgi:hypothetical protein